MTPWQAHVQKWKNGCGSGLCGGYDGCGQGVTVCLARGQIPCDLLFIGEAPGESENCLGRPFVGPAGKRLDYIIRRAWVMARKELRVAMTNLVACIPRDEDDGELIDPPNVDVLKCRPRLVDFVAIAKPRLIVCVGTQARDALDSKIRNPIRWQQGSIPTVDIVHPSAILRANIAQQGLMEQRCVVTLATAMEDL